MFFLLFSVFVHPSNFPSFVKLILWKVRPFSSNKWKNNPKLIHVDLLRHSCYLLATCMAIKIMLYKEVYFKAITYDNTIRCLSAFSVSIDYLIQTNYNSINEAIFVHESFVFSLWRLLGHFHSTLSIFERGENLSYYYYYYYYEYYYYHHHYCLYKNLRSNLHKSNYFITGNWTKLHAKSSWNNYDNIVCSSAVMCMTFFLHR